MKPTLIDLASARCLCFTRFSGDGNLSAAVPPYGRTASACEQEQKADDTSRATARFFFVLAIVAVVIDELWLWWHGGRPNSFAITSLVASIAGLILLSRRIVAAYPAARPYLPESSTLSFIGVFFAFLAFYSVTCSLEATGFNEPVRQSYAYLHGHLWVEDVPDYMEHITWKGHRYLVHPPLAAILLMPAVLIWGTATNQTAVSVALGALEVALAWRLLGLLDVKRTPRIWLTFFYGAGTTLWYEATIGNSWNFVLVVSVLATLVCLNELFGQARPWLLGFLTGAAALARNDLALAMPVYALLLLCRGRRLADLRWLIPGWALAAAIYVGLNLARYGNVYDSTLWIYYLTDPVHSREHGPFSPHYLPANLYTLFFLAPSLNDRFPYIHPTLMGQALPLTSPAFVLALRPSFRRPIPLLLALATVVVSIPSLTVYASGYAQFGTRYYLQVYPFLLVMMALGMRNRVDQLSKILIVVSVFLVSFGFWQIRGLGIG